MMIEVTRTAGVSRLRRDICVDSTELPREQRLQLSTVVHRLDLDDLQARSPIQAREPDRFRYAITFTEEAHVRRVVVDESRLSDDLRALLELLLDG